MYKIYLFVIVSVCQEYTGKRFLILEIGNLSDKNLKKGQIKILKKLTGIYTFLFIRKLTT